MSVLLWQRERRQSPVQCLRVCLKGWKSCSECLLMARLGPPTSGHEVVSYNMGSSRPCLPITVLLSECQMCVLRGCNTLASLCVILM